MLAASEARNKQLAKEAAKLRAAEAARGREMLSPAELSSSNASRIIRWYPWVASGSGTATARLKNMLATVSAKDVGAKDSGGRSLLWWLCRRGAPHELVVTVLAMGADVDEPDDVKGVTPLMNAARLEGHSELVKVLLEHKPDVLAEDVDGNAVLDFVNGFEDDDGDDVASYHMKAALLQKQIRIRAESYKKLLMLVDADYFDGETPNGPWDRRIAAACVLKASGELG